MAPGNFLIFNNIMFRPEKFFIDIMSLSTVISTDIHVSTTTIYLASMAGIFVLAGLLHLQECLYLAHGVWYLLCLPSGYLILLIYSICNITDRSWGTSTCFVHLRLELFIIIIILVIPISFGMETRSEIFILKIQTSMKFPKDKQYSHRCNTTFCYRI